MKNLKHCFWCAFFVVGILCCSKEHNNINIDPLPCGSIDDLFDTCKIVILDSSIQSMISRSGKIMKKDSLYFIHDEDKHKILVFDTNGNYFSKIDHLGRSSMEYTDLTNFDVYKNFIYIISRPDKRIYKYDIFGKFIDRCELDDWYNEFLVINDDSILLFSNYSNDKLNNYVLYDWVEEKPLLECDEFSFNGGYVLGTNHLAQFGNDILTTKPFDYNIYKYSNGSIAPMVELSFNTEYQLKRNKDLSIMGEDAKNKNVIKNFESFTKIQNQYFIIYNMVLPKGGFGAYFLSSVNIEDSTSRTICLGLQRSDKFPLGFDNAVLSGNSLIALISPLTYQRVTSSSMVDESSNYVLLEYKLK